VIKLSKRRFGCILKLSVEVYELANEHLLALLEDLDSAKLAASALVDFVPHSLIVLSATLKRHKEALSDAIGPLDLAHQRSRLDPDNVS
jgi:hypothetical protein